MQRFSAQTLYGERHLLSVCHRTDVLEENVQLAQPVVDFLPMLSVELTGSTEKFIENGGG